MRRWKISGLRDMIFDGPTIWLVVGSCYMTKLIKFDPNNDTGIDIRKPNWKNSTTAYRARVTALGPVSERQGFLVQDRRAIPDSDASFTYWHKGPCDLWTNTTTDLCLPLFERTTVRLRAECDAISTDGNRYVMVDGERDGPHDIPRIWQVNVYLTSPESKVVGVRTLVCPVTWPWCYATTNGVTTGLYFVDFEANRHQAAKDRYILDMLGEKRLERNSPVYGAGDKLFLDDKCFKFTRTVHDARFSPDGLTAFVWGARELVQFDLE